MSKNKKKLVPQFLNWLFSHIKIIFLLLSIFSYQLKANNQLEEINYFIENKGYLDSSSIMWFQSGYNFVRIQKNGYIITCSEEQKFKLFNHQIHSKKAIDDPIKFNYENIKVNFINSNNNSNIISTEYRTNRLNILKDFLSLRTVDKFEIENVYKNINVVYSTVNNQLKLDWKIKIQGNVDEIITEYESSSLPSIDEQGNLHLKSLYSNIIEYKPYAYQIINGITVEVNVKFDLKGNILKFKVENYDKNHELIIDPIIIFSTYSGSFGDNFGFCATFDAEGNLYTAGIVNALQGPYPITSGAFQKTFGGCGSSNCLFPFEISISKYATDGKTLLYASYLGGNRLEFPHSININSKNELLVFGTTASTNFPTSTKAFQQIYAGGGNDLFISKISEDGSKLVASTYLGGNGIDGTIDGDLIVFHNDYYRGEIAEIGNKIIIGSSTRSNDIPVTKDAHQKSNLGGTEGYFAILNNDLDTLFYASYLGGSGEDIISSFKFNKKNQLLYLNGSSNSTDIQLTNNGLFKDNPSGILDGFITTFDINSKTQIYSTFTGFNFIDLLYYIDFNSDGDVFATGITYDFINKSNQCWGENNNAQYIVKYNSILTKQELITTFGSYSYPEPHLSPTAFMIDNCDNIYLSAWGSGMESGFGYNNGTTRDLDVTNDAFQSQTDSNDFYLMVLSKDLKNLNYATFIGGTISADHIDGGMSRFDKNGVIYQSVCASCPDSGNSISDFPVDRNALFKFNTSTRCNNASLKFDLRKGNYSDAEFNFLPKYGCAPLKVSFTPKQSNTSHYWDFGNNTTSNDSQPSSIYKKSGKYIVTHIVKSPITCNFSDTIRKIIEVGKGVEYNLTIDECLNEIKIYSNSDSLEIEYGGQSKFVSEFKISNLDSGKHIFRLSNPKSICNDTIYEIINFKQFPSSELKIENVFTPNGDGINDCYTAGKSIFNCHEIDFIIYDRWGIELFDSKKDGDCWNGLLRNNGNQISDGTYYIIIYDKKEDNFFSASLKLIR